MTAYISWITVVLAIATFLSLFLSYYLFLQRRGKGGLLLSSLLFACTIWSFGVMMESIFLSINERVFWSTISYIGIVCVGPLWFLFSTRLAEYSGKFWKSLFYIVWIIPILVLVFVFTNPLHYKYWSEFTLIGENIKDGIVYGHGPLFYIHITYEYLLLSFGMVILINHILKVSVKDRAVNIFLLISMVLPWIANIIYVFIAPTLTSVEITPIALLLTSLVLIFGVLRYKIMSVSEGYKSIHFEFTDSGILVLDKDFRVLDFNNVAGGIFTGIKIGIDFAQNYSAEYDFIEKMRSNEAFPDVYYNKTLDKWFFIKTQRPKSKAIISIELQDITSLKRAKRV